MCVRSHSVYLLLLPYIRMGVCNFVWYLSMEHDCGQYSATNCRCDVSAFHLQRSMCQPSKIDDRCVNFRRLMSTFRDRCVDHWRSMIDVSTFEDRWSMCRPSKINDRCVDLRRSMVDVSTFEDRWSMWNYAPTLAQNIDTIVECKLRQGFALQCFHFIIITIILFYFSPYFH